MRPHGYRYSYENRRNKRNNKYSWFKIILLFLLCAVLIWFLYREKIGEFVKKLTPNSESTILETITPETGPPAITINIDGKKYKVEGVDNSSIMPDTAFQKIGIGKNSIMEIEFEKVPESVNTMLYLNDVRVLSTNSTQIKSKELSADGEYKGVCEVNWGDIKDSQNMVIYPFTLMVDFPPSLSISATDINPGELIVICAENLDDDEKLEIETDLDFKPNVYKYANKHIIMLPVSYYNEPDKVYQIKITMGEEEYSYALKVNDKEFITQYMTIDTKVAASTRNEKSAQEIDNMIDPLKPISDFEPYWQGKFLMPVEGGRVSEKDFGKRRYVNNSPTSYRHNGLDIGHDKGEPIMASNNGRVLLADCLIETGNTVIIEHGFGLKTWYYHMDELNVQTDDWVKKGDIIGTVGSTGFSTGPHLHFASTINGVFINPITLINEGVPLFEPE